MDTFVGKTVVIGVIWGVIFCIGLGFITGLVGVVLTGAVIST